MDATWKTELTDELTSGDTRQMLLSVDGNLVQEIEVEVVRPIPDSAYTLVRTDPLFKVLSDEAQIEVERHINLSMYPLTKFVSVENENTKSIESVE